MTHDLVTSLHPLLAAEASAEAQASGAEPGDLEQAVWLRLLERLESEGPPSDPHRWLRSAVRTEARRTRRRVRNERPYGTEPAGVAEYAHEPERLALAAARHRALRDAMRRLPGRCPGWWRPCCRPRTSHTGKSRGSWVSHRAVLVRNAPDVWDVCGDC